MESQIKGIISEAVLANDPETIMTCFELLSKLFKNIIDNPKEPKFRQFNSENQHLKGKVLNIPQISLLIEIIGYCESETKGILVISDDLLGNIEICYKEIQSFIKLNEKSKIDKIESFTNVDKYQNNDINKGKYKVTLYVYDLTRFLGFNKNWISPTNPDFVAMDDLNPYFKDHDKKAFLIKINNEIAGFILTNKLEIMPEVDFYLNDFFISAKFQDKQIGKQVAVDLFNQLNGKWALGVIPEHKKALHFWRRTLSLYKDGNFTESLKSGQELKTKDHPDPYPMIIFSFDSNL